ncbi:hypothetical protein TW95_gp1126 [Pandoravirus inopinatum]|uniref:Uncharacterized protein n=1 Tax=Pandoravirus inopinatum TaxID=1605721 RepID=A0A0B5J7J1_9VIRU|nr:hypothetical protein TW95_gp1126 [Pandoravirus inopinatum]AJF97860.1 hypothetical protein [Pandoravirus inopinatum]
MSRVAMPRRTAPIFVAVLAACALLAVRGALALDTDPIISYGQRFKIYAMSTAAFCRTDCAQLDCAVLCDVSEANITQATYFVLGGSCGRVVPSNLTLASLYAFDGGSCASAMGSIENPTQFRCKYPQCGPDAPRFNILNEVAPSDGWLRGNSTTVYIRQPSVDPVHNWCTALWPSGNFWCAFSGPQPGFKFVLVD